MAARQIGTVAKRLPITRSHYERIRTEIQKATFQSSIQWKICDMIRASGPHIETIMPRYISLLATVALLAACSSDTTGTGTRDNNGNNQNNVNNSNNANNGNNVNNRNSVASLAIEPAVADLVSVDAAEVTQQFSAVATLTDGSTNSTLPTIWEIDDLRIGRIGERDGVFTGNGLVGGEATITATLVDDASKSATAIVRVRLERELITMGSPADIAMSFQGAGVDDAARAAAMVYPLEGAVMPQNVYPADVQWERGVAGDRFRITLEKPNAKITAYAEHSGAGFGNHWLVDEDSWRSIAQTDPTDEMTITVDRWEAASSEYLRGAPVTMRFAEAALSGSVYYWDIAAGRIVRINDGSGTREEFMPTPPTSPNGESCVGCHTVSNDGRYMVGRLGGGYNAGAVFDLTQDLTQSPPPTEYAVSGSSPYWNFATWSPDNSRLVVTGNEWNLQGMRLVDPFAGTDVALQGGALPGAGTTHPAWSPDGTLLAYVANAGGFGGSNVTGDIALMDVPAADTFENPRTIQAGNAVPNAVPAGNAASYPTWSPDSEWIAFAHGTGSRSEDQQSALYLMRRDGTGLVRLDNASGGPNATNTFLPNFSPFDQGGYFWVSYLSRRDYGNNEVGTKGSGLQQIWVSAIKANPMAGEDPSEVGYWLPAQNTQSRNISAYWAPRACRMDGEGCSVGTECCSGECTPNANGELVCSPPPPDRCREIGESCNQVSDCCNADRGDIICQSNACIRIVN